MSEKPLHNVVICCTSVTQEERSAIMRHALEMGAVLQADLTSDVTHLIVARLQTDKYKFAARHRTDIKLMRVDWIPAIHTTWINGKDVNLYESEEKYRLPTFHGLRICVTNLDVELRMQIERIVVLHGGQYTGDLTKENTHLVAGSATGKKWEAVNLWQCDISIVGVEWVYESVKRGASLDEKYFRLELSAEIRGQSSWFPPRIVPKLSEDFTETETKGDKRKRLQGQQIARKRSTRRNPNYLDAGLWSEILVDDDVDRQQSFAARQEDISHDLPPVQLDLPSRFVEDLDHDILQPQGTNMLSEDLNLGIFDKISFYVSGFAPREDEIVRRTVLSNGGRLLDTEVAGEYYITPQNGRPPVPKLETNMVTEFWLERCLSQHRYEDPSAHFTSKPFTAELPIARMDQISICSSGFSAVESMHIEKLIKKVGAIYCDTLTKGRSILLAATRECRKFNLAKENGTRVIKVEWLWECIRRGKMVGVTDYALDGVLGSQCRIDASVTLKQRRGTLLKGVVCHISRTCDEAFGKLINMAQSMGAHIADSRREDTLTHYVGYTVAEKELGDHIIQVSEAWLIDTFTLVNRQPESSYPSLGKANDENIPPKIDKTIDSERRGAARGSNQKLTSEMNEIRKRINTGPVRRTSRRILGRATTLPCTETVAVMMTTDAEEVSERIDGVKAASQGITYSDPETMEKQRVLMKKLGALQNGSISPSSLMDHSKTGSRASMRAVGLDDVRKLRR